MAWKLRLSSGGEGRMAAVRKTDLGSPVHQPGPQMNPESAAEGRVARHQEVKPCLGTTTESCVGCARFPQ